MSYFGLSFLGIVSVADDVSIFYGLHRGMRHTLNPVKSFFLMAYSELLKSPHWQRKRLEVMQRDDFTCQYCADKENTLVHHILYLPNSEPWEYQTDCLITICERCHGEEEKLKDVDDQLINKLGLTGLSRHKLHALALELGRYLRNKKDAHARYMELLNFMQHG